MTWIDVAREVGRWAVTLLIVSGALVWLAKQVVMRVLDAAVAKYRLSLEHTNKLEADRLRADLERAHRLELDRFRQAHEVQLEQARVSYSSDLERLRTALRTAAHKIEARQSVLVARQAEVIARTYELLAKAENLARDAMALARRADGPTASELAPGANNAAVDFVEHCRHNRIFFTQSAVAQLDELCESFRLAFAAFTMFGIEYESDALRSERIKQRTKAWSIVTEQIPTVKARLEHEFRLLLGVIDDAPPPPEV